MISSIRAPRANSSPSAMLPVLDSPEPTKYMYWASASGGSSTQAGGASWAETGLGAEPQANRNAAARAAAKILRGRMVFIKCSWQRARQGVGPRRVLGIAVTAPARRRAAGGAEGGLHAVVEKLLHPVAGGLLLLGLGLGLAALRVQGPLDGRVDLLAGHRVQQQVAVDLVGRLAGVVSSTAGRPRSPPSGGPRRTRPRPGSWPPLPCRFPPCPCRRSGRRRTCSSPGWRPCGPPRWPR